MNMQELIAEIAANQKISKAKTKRVIGSLITQINKSINDGEVFRVPGLGTFRKSFRKERVCRNPSNGEQMVVQEKFVPKMTFSKNVKTMLIANNGTN